MFGTLSNQTKTYFKQELTNAFVQSQTIDEITGNILARLPIINKRIKQHLTTQSRTILNGISNGMFSATAKTNSDIISGYQLLITLDSRTSAICQAYGSHPDRVYPINKHPTPPFHYNCRTVLIPTLKDEYAQLFDNNNATRPSKFYNQDGSLESIKRVSTNLGYDQWLRQQPKAFQQELLGLTKYKLFNSGVKLDKFVDRGRELSVGELKDKFAEFLITSR